VKYGPVTCVGVNAFPPMAMIGGVTVEEHPEGGVCRTYRADRISRTVKLGGTAMPFSYLGRSIRASRNNGNYYSEAVIFRAFRIWDMAIANIPSYPQTGYLDSEKLCAFAPLREKIPGARAKPVEAQRKMGLILERELEPLRKKEEAGHLTDF